MLILNVKRNMLNLEADISKKQVKKRASHRWGKKGGGKELEKDTYHADFKKPSLQECGRCFRKESLIDDTILVFTFQAVTVFVCGKMHVLDKASNGLLTRVLFVRLRRLELSSRHLGIIQGFQWGG